MLNDEDYSDDADTEKWKPFFQQHKKLTLKAREIFTLLRALEESFPKDELEDRYHPVYLMQENIMKAQAKLAGAESLNNLYRALMENAVLVKVNMSELKVQLFSASEFYTSDKDYLSVIKKEVEEFRLLFVEWIKTFDSSVDLPDEWHLFNDPDSFPDDED